MSSGGGEAAPALERTPSKGREETCSASDGNVDNGEFEPYVQALRAVIGGDDARFREVGSQSPRVLEDVWRGWPLLLHIYAENEDMLGIYRELGGKMDVKTSDFVPKLCGAAGLLYFIGGQTILHWIAQLYGRKRLTAEAFEALCAEHPSANCPDFNGRDPLHYYTRGREATPSEAKKEFEMVRSRIENQARIVLPPPAPVALLDAELHPGIRPFAVPAELCLELLREVEAVPESAQMAGNSMHRYGKIITVEMGARVGSLVAALLPAEDRDKVIRLHAFYIKYSASVGQTSLDLHRDDSAYTINVCLSADESCGSALRFPSGAFSRAFNSARSESGSGEKYTVFDFLAAGGVPDGFLYAHEAGRGVIHKGDLNHYVENLSSGGRENLIVWVTIMH